jgi:hypothetical protein
MRGLGSFWQVERIFMYNTSISFAKFQQRLYVETDASINGLEAILSQAKKGGHLGLLIYKKEYTVILMKVRR